MKVEEFESVKDFQRGFVELAHACEKKFRGDIRRITIYPQECKVDIEFA